MGETIFKKINIQSLLQAEASLSDSAFKAFLGHYGIEIKSVELKDLSALAAAMHSIEGYRISHLDNFHIGYKIPQIGKEFDLLRFGKESIVNIEWRIQARSATLIN